MPKNDLYFKSDSNWEPNNIHHTVKTFTEEFRNKIKKSLENGPQGNINRKNLSKKETKAMNDLKEREDIVVTKADKGGAIVINDVNDYVDEANRQLSNRKFYKRVAENPTSEHAALVENAIDSLKIQGHLEEKMANKPKPKNPKTPRLYLQPKIH